MIRWPYWGSYGYVKPTLGAQEHRRETQIDDVDLFKHDIVKNQRTPKGSGDQGGHFGTSWCPLWALLVPSWGTVGAYEFDMLKKHESSATAEKWGPAAGSQSRGETLSKQVYLGRV